MFITVNERPLNLFAVMYHYTRDVEKDGKTSYNMYYRLTDGRIIEEEFQDIELRNKRVAFVNAVTLGGLIQKDTYADFPTTGGAGSIYLAKDTGQVYYYDDKTKIYEKIGTAGKTGVYSVNAALPQTIGDSATLNKADLTEIVKPSVDYSDGSEVIGTNSVHALIVSSDATTVTVKTVTDLVIDSFVQVATETNLPTNGVANVLYYLQDKEDFRVWDAATTKYIKPKSLGASPFKLYRMEIPELHEGGLSENVDAYADNIAAAIMESAKEDKLPIIYSSKHKGLFTPRFSLTDVRTTGFTSFLFDGPFNCYTSKTGAPDMLGCAVMNITMDSNTDGVLVHKGGQLLWQEQASFLSLYNKRAYTPTTDYHPATKKYVDDSVLTNSGLFKLYEIDLPVFTNNTVSIDVSNFGGSFKQALDECMLQGKLPLLKSSKWRSYFYPTFTVDDLKDTTKLAYSFCVPFHLHQQVDTTITQATMFGSARLTITFTGHTTTAFSFSSSGKANIGWFYGNPIPVLSLKNEYNYTPTANYHPATKKYVDDSIKAVKEYTEDLTFDGASDEFTIPANVVGNDFEVYINGFRLFETDDYTIDATTNKIKFTMIYDTWDVCKFVYAK